MEYPGFYIGGDEESVRKAHANFSAQGVVYYLEETDHAENNIIAILFAYIAFLRYVHVGELAQYNCACISSDDKMLYYISAQATICKSSCH